MKLSEIYNKKVIDYFKENFGYKNILAIPKIEKVVVNTGIGREQSMNPKFIETAAIDIAKITGQKPKITRSSKAISGFKLRKGIPVGLVVTMRGKKMDDFLTRLINIVLPRIRDFRGLKVKALDNYGNLNIGISEHTVFPEVKAEQVVKPFGLQINIVSSAKNRKEALELFTQIGFIFEK
jgi:large subunit ribosomal protein L5